MSEVNRGEKREMPLPLDHWQDRLARHFASLAATRKDSGFPVFALEHPLTPTEVEQMSSLLRAHILTHDRLGALHWLCWVVYATEIGYGYTGDEYWQSFEEATPGWQFHHRDALRARFRRFQQTYAGVKPSGAWANNFPIIAWPITHSILPRYLQYQFAYAIYQLRFRLTGIGSLDAASAGRLLASHSYDTSKRFQQFLQQEKLTGRILLGLLGISPQDGPAPIYDSTLTRIVADLDAVPRTRTRLRETRTIVDRFKGMGRPGGGHVRDGSEGNRNSIVDFSNPDIRPRIFLRHSGGGKWSVAVDVPSFAPVAAMETDLGAFLRRTRCRVAGASDVKPAGWVLSHSRVSIIKSWPDNKAPLIQFEKSHHQIDRLLQADCVLSTGRLWLFKLGSDGVAREIVGRIVRPGIDYIVLSPRGAPEDCSMVSACKLDCTGINAYRLSIPENVSAEATKWLSELGIEVARTVRVWPAGLPCRGWDGERQSEWLTTEGPCFGIIHDHPVSQYIVRLNDLTEVILPAPSIGVPTFISLQALPAGNHKLTITANRHDSLTDIAQQASPEGVAHLTVREPVPWVPGIPSHAGLIVNIDPHDTDLDEFWENKVAIAISGPETHSVTCAVSLERSDGEELFHRPIPGTFNLPVTPEAWHRKFGSFVKKEEGTNWRYPEAAVGRLHIDGGELGSTFTSFSREATPVRWVTRYRNSKLMIKLVDDSDIGHGVLCRSYPMLKPLTSTSLEVSDVINGFFSEPPGTLYVARKGKHQDAIVVSHGLAQQGLQGLGVLPDSSELTRNEVPITQAIHSLELWSSARLVGPLGEIRRTQVTRELSSRIFRNLCGKKWATAENEFQVSDDLKLASRILQRQIDSVSGFTAELENNYVKFLDDIARSVDWYLSVAKRNHVSATSDNCEFAIRLCFRPQTLSSAFNSNLSRQISKITSEQELLRGARFGALLCERYLPNEYTRFTRSLRF